MKSIEKGVAVGMEELIVRFPLTDQVDLNLNVELATCNTWTGVFAFLGGRVRMIEL